MKNAHRWKKPLLLLHLFVCIVWLYAFHVNEADEWVFHVMFWSILGIQFTWGFTVGLIVGPGRKRRPLLWWSLLTVSMPMWLYGHLLRGIFEGCGPLIALGYLAIFTAIVASETYCGVLLGAKMHSEGLED